MFNSNHNSCVRKHGQFFCLLAAGIKRFMRIMVQATVSQCPNCSHHARKVSLLSWLVSSVRCPHFGTAPGPTLTLMRPCKIYNSAHNYSVREGITIMLWTDASTGSTRYSYVHHLSRLRLLATCSWCCLLPEKHLSKKCHLEWTCISYARDQSSIIREHLCTQCINVAYCCRCRI